MSSYLEMVRSVPGTRCPQNTSSGVGIQDATHNKHRLEEQKLKAAGWRPKRRGGLTIWESPDRRGWYSQEMALHLLKRKMFES